MGASGERVKTLPPPTLYSASVANSLRSQRTEAPGIPENRLSPARGLGQAHESCTEPGRALPGTCLQVHRQGVVSSLSKHPERQILSDPTCAALIFPERFWSLKPAVFAHSFIAWQGARSGEHSGCCCFGREGELRTSGLQGSLMRETSCDTWEQEQVARGPVQSLDGGGLAKEAIWQKQAETEI